MVIRDGDGQGAPLRVVYIGGAGGVITGFQFFCQLVWYRYHYNKWHSGHYQMASQFFCKVMQLLLYSILQNITNLV